MIIAPRNAACSRRRERKEKKETCSRGIRVRRWMDWEARDKKEAGYAERKKVLSER